MFHISAPHIGGRYRGHLASLESGTSRGISLCGSYSQLLSYLIPPQNRQQLPSVVSLIRCIGSQVQGGVGRCRKDAPWGVCQYLREGDHRLSLHIFPSSPLTLQIGYPFRTLAEKSLVYNFRKHTYFTRVAEREEMGWEYTIFLKSTIVWIFEHLSPRDFKIIYLCWLLNSHKASLIQIQIIFSSGYVEDWNIGGLRF